MLTTFDHFNASVQSNRYRVTGLAAGAREVAAAPGAAITRPAAQSITMQTWRDVMPTASPTKSETKHRGISYDIGPAPTRRMGR
jgi:hypothetical protein